MQSKSRRAEFAKKLKRIFPNKSDLKIKLLLHAMYHESGRLVTAQHYGCRLVFIDPHNVNPDLTDVETNAVTQKLLRENLRTALSGFPAAAKGLGAKSLRGEACADVHVQRMAKLLSKTGWQNEIEN